jgi:Uma2 family endonuclease
MLRVNTQTAPAAVEYPDDDGLPMADNSKQFRWITTVAGNLACLFRAREDVLVGGNMLWYAREGDPAERFAPDAFVVFGRPKGDRGSYKQWVEGDVPMTVVFEILSPSNSWREMTHKLAFYGDYGAEEFYIYDPETNELEVYLRGKATLRRIYEVDGFVSPRLGIRFDLSGEELMLRHADGRPFLTFEELEADRESLMDERDQATDERDRATQRFNRLAELVRKQATQQATPEELAELQRLLKP